jgi:pimeloyl-ACP methyl ester carboxylesterase
VLACIVLIVITSIYALCTAGAWQTPLVKTKLVEHHGTSLFVVVHGYHKGTETLGDLVSEIESKRPDADILLVDFPNHVFSNASAAEISDELATRISETYETGHYKHIALVGHSMGALLVRKAYVYGLGRVDDLKTAVQNPRPPQPWVWQVDRIVLLAGMNRGWSLDPAGDKMPLWKEIEWRYGIFISDLTDTGHLVRDCARGESFVANLRLQWMRAFRSFPVAHKKPAVVQLLGTIDDVVSNEDNADVSCANDLIFVPVHGTGHLSILDFHDQDYGPERRAKFSRAISSDDDELRRLAQENSRRLVEPDHSVKHLVFVMHGIRDLGPWCSGFEGPLQEEFHQLHKNDGERLVVPPETYPYFGMGPFLLPWERHRYVRWFMDLYTEQLAMYPDADPEAEGTVDYIGHSNGTYILARALQDYPTLKVCRVVFAGSVARQDYNWNLVFGRGQIRALLNYSGASDWVVGWFPTFFEQWWHANDIGSAGFNGFTNLPVEGHQISFVPGAHDAALVSGNVASICNFIIRGQVDVPSNYGLRVPAQDPFVRTVSAGCIFLWVGIVALIIGIGFLVIRTAERATKRTVRAEELPRRWLFRVGVGGGYVLFLYVLLTLF